MKAFVMEKYVMRCAVIDAQLPNYLHLKVAVVRDNPEPLYAEILLPHYAVQFIGLKNPPKKLGFSAETEPVHRP